eukprot:GEMP01100396.1.p1 GENE.GEMP01100396.1~~GEMP01100396.1.p1  ORF type:complete len:109 (+),score=24.01 GEMP01100396.1:473-799(+)
MNIPLHFAALYGNYDVCLVLLEAGCAIKPRNVRGLTPASLAFQAADGPATPGMGRNSIVSSCTVRRAESRQLDSEQLQTDLGRKLMPEYVKREPRWSWTLEQADYLIK